MISFKPLRDTLDMRGISIYALERQGLFGKATTPVLKSDKGNINTKTLNAICNFLQCSVDHVVEWIPDNEDKPKSEPKAD